MEFVGAIEYGDAPETFVSGVARIAKVNRNVVRLTFYIVKHLDDGSTEHRVACHQLWAHEALHELYSFLRAAIEAMRGGQLIEAPNCHQREIH